MVAGDLRGSPSTPPLGRRLTSVPLSLTWCSLHLTLEFVTRVWMSLNLNELSLSF